MVILSFGTAGVIALFVEFPLHNLEMVIFKAVGLKVRRNVASHESDVAFQNKKQESVPD